MPTRTMEFNADQVRDFNTRPEDQLGDGSVTIRANDNSPDRLLDGNATANDPTHSDVLNGATVTGYRATFEVDADDEVVPGSVVGIEYTTDNGATWQNFYDDSNLAEDGYGEYIVVNDGGGDGFDGPDEWVSIVAIRSGDGDTTGFMLADQPLSTGELFTTMDIASTVSEFSVVCFTTGMRFETDKGLVAVEDLQLGDMVHTLDRGLQPVRFIYRRKVRAMGAMRPVIFKKGALGNNERFVVSQKHRIHTSALAGIPEAMNNSLIEAIELVNGSSVVVSNEHEYVEYFHVMFDNHELVNVEGVLSESWQPHKRNLKRDARLRQELLSIFPEIETTANGAPVRSVLKRRAVEQA